MSTKTKNKIKDTRGDRVLKFITTLLLILLLIIVGYPVLYVVACSFSSANALRSGRVFFLPIDPTLAGYKFVFQYKQVWLGYRNTLFYTFTGTLLNMFLSIICAYPLSKPDLPGKGIYTKYFVFTMLFGAGLIPNYILKSKLGLVNTVWVLILSGALSVHNMIIIRTAFRSSIPSEIFEAAKIDGASDAKCLTKIAIPLAKPTLSVVTLYYAVGHWNQYFTAMIYLRNQKLFPLQLILRSILTAGESIDMTTIQSETMLAQIQDGTQQIKYALIVISTVPVLLLYMIVQKYFKKGVMIGSVKG